MLYSGTGQFKRNEFDIITEARMIVNRKRETSHYHKTSLVMAFWHFIVDGSQSWETVELSMTFLLPKIG